MTDPTTLAALLRVEFSGWQNARVSDLDEYRIAARLTAAGVVYPSAAPAPLREAAQAVVDAWADLTSDTATANSLGLMAAAVAALRAALATPGPDAGTWCREHRTLDLCPETCPRCHGYWHGASDCRYAAGANRAPDARDHIERMPSGKPLAEAPTPPDALDVERLARALERLDDGAWEADPAATLAKAIAREYAALATPGPDRPLTYDEMTAYRAAHGTTTGLHPADRATGGEETP